jgi:hypothetical protein
MSRSAPSISPPPMPAGPMARSCCWRRSGTTGATTATRASGLQAPWLTLEAAQWLAERKPTAVAFDFPQDYPIRLLLEGKEVPKPEHVTHHVLLSHGVTLIEYVVNTSKLTAPRNLFSAAPLLIPNADGAPARIYAIEGLAGLTAADFNRMNRHCKRSEAIQRDLPQRPASPGLLRR